MSALFSDLGEIKESPGPAFSDLGEPADSKGKAKFPGLGNLISSQVGQIEGAASFLSGALAPIAAGYSGLAVGAGRALGLTSLSPSETVHKVSEALTYRPRTEKGQQTAEVLNYPFEKIGEGVKWVGNKVFEKTGSPAAGTGTETILTGVLLATPMVLKKLSTRQPVGQTPDVLDSFNLKQVGKTIVPEESLTPARAERATPITSALDLQEPVFKTSTTPFVGKSISELARDVLSQDPELARSVGRPIDFIMEQGLARRIPQELLDKHGLTQANFEAIYRESVADAGRNLNYLSRIKSNLTPEERVALSEIGSVLEDSAQALPAWKRLTNVWRAGLVVQPATAIRNFITQMGRVGLDTLQAPLDAAIQRAFGLPQKANPLDGISTMAGIFRKNKKTVDTILERFPDQRDRLLSSYFSELPVKTGPIEGVLGTAEGAVNMANFMNRFQEFLVRRGVFQTTLEHRLRNSNLSLSEIIRKNEIEKIPLEDIKASVEKALDVTFALQPKSGPGRAFVQFFNNIPGLNIPVPFPRFLTQALKFQYQYSPLGILEYLSKSERASLVSGNTSAITKAIIGGGLLGTAFAFRNSEWAGEKWYEAVNPETGKIYDLRPFNPFVSYLFVSDLVKKMRKDELYKLSGKDIAMGILSTNMRAGTGLYLMDSAINLISQTAESEKFKEKAKQLSGEVVAGFLTFLAPIRDLYDQFTEGTSVARDTRLDAFWGPLKRQIPGVSQTLPPVAVPTRQGPVETINPFGRQLTGLAAKTPKNPLEKELDRLGFDRQSILPSSGDPEVNRLYAQSMGILSERVLVPLVVSERYKSLNDKQRAAVLEEALSEVRADVREYVNERLPKEKQLERAIKELSPRLRLLVKDVLNRKQ